MQTMPIVADGHTFYTAAEAAKFLGISRDTFYRSVIGQLTGYQLGVLKRTHYKLTDLQRLKSIRPVDSDDEQQS